LEDGRHGHLIVIANPNDVKSFDKKITELLGSIAPDNFATDITSIGRAFDEFDPIFIPHYYNKTPSISNEDIELLASSVSNRKRILKEANNSISAGIFIGHGHKTIYGSDVTDWNDYPSISQRLPDLRLPVESFEQFCLLIERDDATIDTIRNKKFHQTINIKPFKEDSPFDIEIWDDINVIFGSKGTGKPTYLKRSQSTTVIMVIGRPYLSQIRLIFQKGTILPEIITKLMLATYLLSRVRKRSKEFDLQLRKVSRA